MRFNRLAISVLGTLALIASAILPIPAMSAPAEPEGQAQAVNITPKPVSTKLAANAKPFTVRASTVIVARGEANGAAQLLAETLRKSTGFALPVKNAPAKQAITVTVDPAAAAVAGVKAERQDEAYVLTVDESGVKILARTATGALWGVQSLLQLLGPWSTLPHATTGPWNVPALTIADGPRYEWRGMLLDPVRNFYPVNEVKAIIDQLSRYKMNVLHMHLNDDQGWRLEMQLNGDKYDAGLKALTEVSGKTAYMEGKSRWAPQSGGRAGFYTIADFEELVKYAASRGITIVPELDGPGHATAILHAIPELNTEHTFPQPPAGKKVPDPFDESTYAMSTLDPMHEPTFEYLSRMMGSMVNQAGLGNDSIHIGGDESTKTTHAAFRVYMQRVLKMSADYGKQPLIWNDALHVVEDLLPSNAIVQWWRGYPKAGNNWAPIERFANRGGRFLVSPAVHAYFPQRESTNVPGPARQACQGACSLKVHYEWDPAKFMHLDEERIVGLEGAAWSEHLRTDHDMQFTVFPRLLAHAEIGWTPEKLKDFTDFTRRVAIEGTALNANDVTFHLGPFVDWQVAATGVNHIGDHAVKAPAAGTTAEKVLVGYISAPGQALADVNVSATFKPKDGAGAAKPLGVELVQEKAFHFTDPGRTTGRQMGSIIQVWAKPGVPAGKNHVQLQVKSPLGQTTATSILEVKVSKDALVTTSFDVKGIGVAPAPVKSKPGEVANLPTPQADGYQFKGWHLDKNLTKPVPVPYKPTGSATLYAKWVPVVVDGGVYRAGGANRYVTAVELSAKHFPDGADVVYLASGQAYPDALAASAVAGDQHVPVLLAESGRVPLEVGKELRRLDPKRVVLVGGPAALNDVVLSQVRKQVPGAKVERIGGDDRFETAALLATKTFSGGAETVYVASGMDFPDALTASAAAGSDGGPVLLVIGDQMPESTLEALGSLGVKRVVIVGGDGVVNAVVAGKVKQAVGQASVVRHGGANRFATARLVAEGEFDSGSRHVVVANGFDYPDALVGAAVAGMNDSPVLLTQPDVLSVDTGLALRSLHPKNVTVVGGKAVVSEAVRTAIASETKLKRR